MPSAKSLPTLVAPAPVTVPLVGTAFDARGYPQVDVTLRATSLTGTVAARVETSADQVWWDTLGEPITLTEVGKVRALRDGAERWVRLVLEPSGGSVTGAILAEVRQVYASLADLHRLALNAEGLVKVSLDDQMQAIAAASDVATSYLRKAPSVSLPLLGWGGDLAEAVVKIAAYNLQSAKGYQPTSDQENELRKRYLDALRWLALLQSGGAALLDPDDTADTVTPAPLPEVYGDISRGW